MEKLLCKWCGKEEATRFVLDFNAKKVELKKVGDKAQANDLVPRVKICERCYNKKFPSKSPNS